MTKLFAGRYAVVTGAAGAIGAAITKQLAEDGAALALIDLSGKGLLALKSALSATGVEILSIEADLGQESDVETAVDKVTNVFGRCDILVNNVGVLPKATSFEHLTSEIWDRTLLN